MQTRAELAGNRVECVGLGEGTFRVVPYMPGEGVSKREHGLCCRNRSRPSQMGAAQPVAMPVALCQFLSPFLWPPLRSVV